MDKYQEKMIVQTLLDQQAMLEKLQKQNNKHQDDGVSTIVNATIGFYIIRYASRLFLAVLLLSCLAFPKVDRTVRTTYRYIYENVMCTNENEVKRNWNCLGYQKYHTPEYVSLTTPSFSNKDEAVVKKNKSVTVQEFSSLKSEFDSMFNKFSMALEGCYYESQYNNNVFLREDCAKTLANNNMKLTPLKNRLFEAYTERNVNKENKESVKYMLDHTVGLIELNKKYINGEDISVYFNK